MREETMIEAINDIDSIRCMVEDIHEEITNTPDYWTRLEHQYAGMAMQGILSNNELYREICKSRNLEITIMEYAHALVEKMKEERK